MVDGFVDDLVAMVGRKLTARTLQDVVKMLKTRMTKRLVAGIPVFDDPGPWEQNKRGELNRLCPMPLALALLELGAPIEISHGPGSLRAFERVNEERWRAEWRPDRASNLANARTRWLV